ncbi:DoxX family protein [Demequina sp.]|uniref:DoxX family protein n=1 Tax=Demequina sp. TaxID=2050685 RepID=UPI0025F9C14D|nr:DoxX family protein [Demequina sp.]
MITALWILNGILAAVYLGAGGIKLVRTKEQLRTSGQGWTDDFSQGAIRGIGTAELLGAIGLILPLATGIAPILTPLAAVGLAADMVGAVMVHRRRGDPFIVPAVLAVLAAASAVLGFMHVLG